MTAMTRRQTIESKLQAGLDPRHLAVIDESHQHSVPAGAESHFKLVIVAEAFTGKRLVQRHQQVNGLLRDEFAGGLHALSMETLTPAEWQARGGQTLASPACLGGSKAG